MTTSIKRQFERAFAGPINAGLRKEVRNQVNGAWCGPENARLVMMLAGTIAFTASGLSTLKGVAADYRAVNGDYKATCDCESCVAVSRANLAR